MKMWKVCIRRIPCLKGIVGVIFHKIGTPHLLEKGEGILQLHRQIKKVSGSEGVNVEEFLVDIFKSKRKSFDLPMQEPIPFQEEIDTLNHKRVDGCYKR